MDSRQENKHAPDGIGMNEGVGAKQGDVDSSTVRSWFMQLCPEERIAAMGFVDGRFVSSFLKLASWPGLTREALDIASSKNAAVCEFDYGSSICFDDIKSTFFPLEADQADLERFLSLSSTQLFAAEDVQCPPESSDLKCSWGSIDQSIDLEKGEVAIRKDRVDSDAFRIQQPESEEISAAVDIDARDTSTLEEKVVGSHVEKSPSHVMDIFDNICVVFPSVMKYVFCENLEGIVPFVTIDPSFLVHHNGAKLVQMLDRALETFSQAGSFLSEKTYSLEFLKKCGDALNASSLWFYRLLSTLKTSEHQSGVPIAMLFLTRLEVAVVMSFFNKKYATTNTAQVQRKKNDPFKGTMHDIEFSSIEKLGKGLVTTSEHARSVSKKSVAVDLAVLNNFVSSVLGTTRDSVATSAVKLEHLFLTPLFILKAKLLKENSLIFDFQSWDKTLEISLSNLSNCSPLQTHRLVSESCEKKTQQSHSVPGKTIQSHSVSGKTIQSHSVPSKTIPGGGKSSVQTGNSKANPPSTAKVGTDTSNEKSPPSSGSKKNGKKRKKRKKKKGGNGDNSNQNMAPLSHPPVESSAVDTKKENVRQREPVAERKKPSAVANDKTNLSGAGSTDDLPNTSFESEKTLISTCEETASTKSGSTKLDETEVDVENSLGENKDHITVSRVEGVGTTVVVAPVEVSATNQGKAETNDASHGPLESTAHSEWETVEAKGRGNRKKSSERSHQTNVGRFGSNQGAATSHHTSNHGSNSLQSSGSKKTKASRTPSSRKRVVTRKIVREILSSVLDAVDEEVRRRRQDSRNNSAVGSRSISCGRVETTRSSNQDLASKKETTLRDVVLGRQGNSVKRAQVGSKVGTGVVDCQQGEHSTERKERKDAAGNVSSKARESECGTPGKRLARGQVSGADQNTAPTVPETLSAVSANSSSTDVFRTTNPRTDSPAEERDMGRSDSSSGETDDVRKQNPASSSSHTCKDSSPAPPLPTLLSPGNVNSSSSSVASSLEAPHSTHGHHHSGSASNENDVGCHLLDVCDRLGRDTSLFMSRRATALNNRRRERNSLLSALQESVGSLWPGQCRVEMYGSCATQLDLPSSDLDVVVCGLDQSVTSPTPQKRGNFGGGAHNNLHSPDKRSSNPDPQHGHHQQQMPMSYVYMHMNAERVLRLAAELERQPWAVHVKAIPTASVPVVKVLADPSRVSGSTAPSGEGEDWYIQRHHLVTQQTAPRSGVNPNTGDEITRSFHPTLSPSSWRGSDVMNGLLSLDITFEGPEHGGIGSTEFSARVVREACDETSQPPENTPIVQVVMVLKELLAQRRLNEPFSGGLSSYALLLLVLAVVRERVIVKEELERVERQRRVVAAGGVNSAYSGSGSDGKDSSGLMTETDPVVVESPSHNKAKAASQSPVSGSKVNVQGKGSKTFETPSKTIAGGCSVDGSDNKRSQTSTSKWDTGNALKAVQKVAERPSSSNSKSAATSNNSRQQNSSTKKGGGSSWASIAKMNTANLQAGKKSRRPVSQPNASDNKKVEGQQNKVAQVQKKGGTFADAVARKPGLTTNGTATDTSIHSDRKSHSRRQATPIAKGEENGEKDGGKTNSDVNSKHAEVLSSGKGSSSGVNAKSSEVKNTSVTSLSEQRSNLVDDSNANKRGEPAGHTVKSSNFSSISLESPQPLFPQGFNDVIEVLCSGEATAGKLLMHFLLFYGQYFDAQQTAIDISGKHHREGMFGGLRQGFAQPYSRLSPYIQRRTAGIIDPITGMLTVDPIVVYDPLEGAENNNVARRCFLWSNVRWVFAQSYMTLSSAVERSTTPSATIVNTNNKVKSTSGSTKSSSRVGKGKVAGGGAENSATAIAATNNNTNNTTWNGPYNQDDRGCNLSDPSSPLLELLVSF